MCYNCGCGNPSDDMGNPDNITTDTFQKAANAIKQDLQDAKKETFELLKKELEVKTE